MAEAVTARVCPTVTFGVSIYIYTVRALMVMSVRHSVLLEECHFVSCHDSACILSGRRSQRHLALPSSLSAVGGEFLT